MALERHDHTAVVRPAGELDAETAPQLERALSAVQAPGRMVVLDLRAATVGDAEAVSAIVLALERAERLEGGELRLIPGEGAGRLFENADIAERLTAIVVGDEVL